MPETSPKREGIHLRIPVSDSRLEVDGMAKGLRTVRGADSVSSLLKIVANA